ncbi:hypothetical protein PROFUN_02572 [Planoprotostelium fungivorum]|uniref:Brix domain-containing protein n=1 Tax=Planoprotostelium fungivorum TaxID=1890364 RepID=A0A2P6MPC0_9EUKA|nr:hypothetical protein PROFUN_02572 [Planoprotostelium fungivorum]
MEKAGQKRKKAPVKSERELEKAPARPAEIKNVGVRQKVYREIKKQKKLEKKQKKKERKKNENLPEGQAPPKKIPNTIENMRADDETFVTGEDEEVLEEVEVDEFSDYYVDKKEPKILITTNTLPEGQATEVVETFLNIFPNSEYRQRKNYPLRDIIKFCINREYTDVMIVNEDHAEVNGVLVVHLPHGPTTHFKLTSWKSPHTILGANSLKIGNPELILNNFNTRLGLSVGRMLGALFPHTPNFTNRSAVTFHNQRDFIFFRCHRYIGEEKKVQVEEEEKEGDRYLRGEESDSEEENFTPRDRSVKREHDKLPVKVRLQELGPRFTLKLKSIQKGTLDYNGEYIWIAKKEAVQGRKVFYLDHELMTLSEASVELGMTTKECIYLTAADLTLHDPKIILSSVLSTIKYLPRIVLQSSTQ